MAVSNVPPVATPGLTEEPRGNNKLGKDEFLKLLMAQLSAQDPTAPVDSEAFVAQLAQFASLELQQNVSSHLENLLVAQATANQMSMTNFVGKDVSFQTDTVTLREGEPVMASAQLASKADNVTVVVTDENGNDVRTIRLGAHDAGLMDVTWDGRDDAGNFVPPGDYKVRITAADKEGNSVDVQQRATGHVDGVTFIDGVAQLKVGNATVKVSEIIEIKERTTP